MGAKVSALAASPKEAVVAETTARSPKCDQRERLICMPIPIFDCYDIFNIKYHNSIINHIEYEFWQISRFSFLEIGFSVGVTMR
jgi:hypothetical protein